MEKTSFETLLDRYNVFFLDSYGVIKNHGGLIEGMDRTIQRIIDAGKRYVVLTNDASRNQEQLAESYHNLGLYNVKPEDFVSSGMMAKNFLQAKIKQGIVTYLGTNYASQYISEAGREAVSISKLQPENYHEVSAMVFLDDEGFDWNIDINKTLNLLRYHNIPVIVANTDMIYPKSNREINMAAGSVSRLLENILGRSFIKFGKPDSQMFMYAFDIVNKYQITAKSDILMVGDTLHTDILGGNKFGLATALALTGNTSESEAAFLIRSSNIIPDYLCDSAGI